MVEPEQIFDLVEQLSQAGNATQILLFGSYAYGTPTEDSDVDLLILTRSKKSSHQQFVQFRQQVEVEFAIDLVVRRESDVMKRIAWNDFFLREAMEKGMVLYASDDSRMGHKGRRRLRRRLAAAAVT